jgi:hypothetical protein
MQNQQNEPVVWPFAFVNGERTKQSQELLDSKHYKTKDVFSTDDYEEAML